MSHPCTTVTPVPSWLTERGSRPAAIPARANCLFCCGFPQDCAKDLGIHLTGCHLLWILAPMAEVVKVVVTKEGRGFECQVCGTAWIPRRKNPPRRCPNQKCRTMRWDRDRYPNAGPPQPPHGGVLPNSSENADGAGLRTCYQTLAPAARKPVAPVSAPLPEHQDQHQAAA
jgi:hypothetical protein